MKRLLLILAIIFMFAVFSSVAQELTRNETLHTEPACSGTFVRHTLDHMTRVNADPIRMFDSNGSGLTINDLNNDDLPDIVFASLDGTESILWNEGDLSFRYQELNIPARTRAVVAFDYDGDGWRDLVFTSQRAAPSLWRNLGDGEFDLTPLPGVSHPAYAMNWGDLDGDGDLDMVTGSYDAELAQIMTNDFLFDGGAGVYFYENQDGTFSETRLAESAQALTILLTDLNEDDQWDIAVGNDFAELDQYFTLQSGEWVEFTPFEIITHSTMSFDIGDVDNDGSQELFATDMHPYSEDEETMAAWQPVMESMMEVPMIEGDPQVMVNTMQSISDAAYQNISEAQGVDASGWSWSSKFGDLNSDGFLDLYVVNGMIAEELFGHLPSNELVEENQAYVNLDGSGYTPAPEWGLNATESGRGMSMADLDGDGDLDIVINNLMDTATLFENQLCGGNNLTVSLHQPGTANPDAIGAHLLLHTDAGTIQREIRVASGYLSGDIPQAHFGFASDRTIEALEIIWPDGEITRLEDIAANRFLHITRN